MKKLLFLIFCLPILCLSQEFNLNAYEYVVISQKNDPFDLASTVQIQLQEKGIESYIGEPLTDDFVHCKALFCELIYEPRETISQIVMLYFKDCDNNVITKSQAGCAICAATVKGELKKAAKKAVKKIKQFDNYKYDSKILDFEISKNVDYNGVNLASEESIRDYFDENGTQSIEGIWEFTGGNSNYRLTILKEDYKFNATVLESTGGLRAGRFKSGDLKATFEPASSEAVLTVKWQMSSSRSVKTVGLLKDYSLITMTLEGIECIMYRVYPKIDKKNKKKKKGEWAGNGSGIIISKSGHIITNHHVIDDADDIEVEFVLNDEVQKFNAEIIQVDKTNDLAIIKIHDMNFDGIDNPPYNFKSRSSDVGTKVYAYGYPMALSIMGKEIKVTDGIISSKTGFDGNITTYQITAPIQGGNSGGPLFDDKGNLIAINSSGIRKDIADNVGYSIKTNYVLNLIDILPKSIELPSSQKLASLPLTEQIKQITKYVVLVKVK